MSDKVEQVGEIPTVVWPKGQEIESRGNEMIAMTQFMDGELYHEGLRSKLFEMEKDLAQSRKYFRGACGTKVHHISEWGFPEADLLNARALEFYKRALKSKSAVADLTWASIYRKGDYCMPHSHLRSTASVLYFLDEGDDDPDDSFSGRFCFTDPRMSSCCPDEEGCMTAAFLPDTRPGTMIIFPSQLVHCVNPYTGDTPRITLSWNINDKSVPGEMIPKELRAGAE